MITMHRMGIIEIHVTIKHSELITKILVHLFISQKNYFTKIRISFPLLLGLVLVEHLKRSRAEEGVHLDRVRKDLKIKI